VELVKIVMTIIFQPRGYFYLNILTKFV